MANQSGTFFWKGNMRGHKKRVKAAEKVDRKEAKEATKKANKEAKEEQKRTDKANKELEKYACNAILSVMTISEYQVRGYHIQGRQQARKLPNPDTGSVFTAFTSRLVSFDRSPILERVSAIPKAVDTFQRSKMFWESKSAPEKVANKQRQARVKKKKSEEKKKKKDALEGYDWDPIPDSFSEVDTYDHKSHKKAPREVTKPK
ncbi:MAG: hypothetical protein M1828_004571 [Chrysothrix sp. TS-e1954]|nr:MAG: hypothetical protein M1828_004571 [Chrysothrix sp. TS-e1954]